MAGKNKGISGFHRALSSLCVKLMAGIFSTGTAGKYFFKAETERKGHSESTEDVSVFVQNGNREVQTAVKAFQKFFQLFWLNFSV